MYNPRSAARRVFNTASLHTTWQSMVEPQDVNGRASRNVPAITSLGVDPCPHIVHFSVSLLQGAPASATRTEELDRLCTFYVPWSSIPYSNHTVRRTLQVDSRSMVSLNEAPDIYRRYDRYFSHSHTS
jgi:hypothetical protein